jgi:hypothetical protein
MCKVGTVA